MTITWVGNATTAEAINGEDVTIDLTTITGLAQNDFVIIAYGIGDNDSIDYDMALVSATGWTERADLYSDDTRETNLGVYTKHMGATPDTSVTVDGQGGTDAAVVALAMAFRGVDTTTPMDVAPVPVSASNQGTMIPDPAQVSGLSSGAATVIIGASAHANAGMVVTMPTGYTTNQVDEDSNDTTDITVSIGYNLSPADPENPGQITYDDPDDATYSWASLTMALRPVGSVIPQIMHHRQQQE